MKDDGNTMKYFPVQPMQQVLPNDQQSQQKADQSSENTQKRGENNGQE
jgi:membrane protease subunit HflK